MDQKTIIFMGPQGSGKGTQLELVGKRLREVDPIRKALVVATGRAFRGLMESDTYTAELVKQGMDNGRLQPLFLASWLLAEKLVHEFTGTEHLLFDGFPRTVVQAEVLDDALRFYHREKPVLVSINVPEEIVMERMRSRARHDDTEESIEARLEWYHTEVEPTLEWYRNHSAYHMIEIDGNRPIEVVQKDIAEKLGL
jgi:adenylate kinase